MVSIALPGEMETEQCCEEHEDPVVEPTEPDVREATSELAHMDSCTALPCGPSEESEELCGEKETEAESCAGDSKRTEMRIPSDPEPERGETKCNGQRKLKKTNSWKMVRFQDPSMEDDVLERDSSAESFFPQYATEEWTLSSFAELFMKEDWQDITGRPDNVSVCSTLHGSETYNTVMLFSHNFKEITLSKNAEAVSKHMFIS